MLLFNSSQHFLYLSITLVLGPQMVISRLSWRLPQKFLSGSIMLYNLKNSDYFHPSSAVQWVRLVPLVLCSWVRIPDVPSSLSLLTPLDYFSLPSIGPTFIKGRDHSNFLILRMILRKSLGYHLRMTLWLHLELIRGSHLRTPLSPNCDLLILIWQELLRNYKFWSSCSAGINW